MTINQSTRDKLEQLQDLLAHKFPKGDVAEILEHVHVDGRIRDSPNGHDA